MSFEAKLDPVCKLRLITVAAMDTWRLKPMDLRLLILLVEHFSGPQGCFPSVTRMMAALECSRNAVKDASKRLEALGYIHVERTNGGRNKRNRYYFMRLPKALRSDQAETGQCSAPFKDETGHHSDPLTGQCRPPAYIPLNTSLLPSSTKTSPADAGMREKKPAKKWAGNWVHRHDRLTAELERCVDPYKRKALEERIAVAKKYIEGGT